MMKMMKNKIILIVGPTVTGKTKLSIALAHHFDAEILNTDSCAMYKEPLIGTAKVTDEEMDGIKHHLVSNVSLNAEYTIFDFQKDGREIIDDLISKGKNIVIVGGSGLYVKSLLYNYELLETETKRVDYSNYSNEELKKMADEIDPSNGIHTNNRHRLERYITFYNETGSTIKKTPNINKKVYDFVTIGLKSSREEMYDRINKRVDEMFDMGLLDEAHDLYSKHYNNLNNIIGYKELIPYFENKTSLEEAKDEIKKDTRHLAKRQMTFYNHQFDDIKWFDVNYNDFNETIQKIIEYLD